MATRLSELPVDHHYAPGVEPDEPHLWERFLEWYDGLASMYLEDALFVAGALFVIYIFFCVIRSIFRAGEYREEISSMQRRERLAKERAEHLRRMRLSRSEENSV